MTQAEALKQFEPLIWSLAKKVTYKVDELEDLVEEGKIAILHLLTDRKSKNGKRLLVGYDPKRSKFITVLYRCILNRMTNYRVNTDSFIGCSKGYTYYVSRTEKFMKLGMDLESAINASNSPDNSRESIKQMVAFRQRISFQLDRPDKEGEERGEAHMDSGERTDQKAFSNIEAKEVRKAINSIKNMKYKIILRMYYGIQTKQRNLREIGKILRLSRERVRQIRDLAIWEFKRKYTKRSRP